MNPHTIGAHKQKNLEEISQKNKVNKKIEHEE